MKFLKRVGGHVATQVVRVLFRLWTAFPEGWVAVQKVLLLMIVGQNLPHCYTTAYKDRRNKSEKSLTLTSTGLTRQYGAYRSRASKRLAV